MFDLFKRKPVAGPTPPAGAPADAAAGAVAENPAAPEQGKPSWTERLRSGLSKSREKLSGALVGVFSRRTLDEETLEELETALITADVGVPGTAPPDDARTARAGRVLKLFFSAGTPAGPLTPGPRGPGED